MTQTDNTPQTGSAELDVVDVLAGLIRQKRLVLGVTAATTTMALVASLLMAPVYTSTTTILPPQQQSSGLAAALGSLGALAGAAGGIAGIKNPNDLYVGMLQSQTVSDALIAKYALQQRYDKESLVETRKALEGVSSISAGKDGLISVTVEDEDPKFAAQLANAYISELKKLNQTLAVTDASQRRLFFEKQLEKVKAELADAEVQLKKTQQATGLVAPEGQVAAVISGVAELKAQIAAKEVQMAAMRSMVTDSNPDYQRHRQELQAMKQQLQQLESKDKAGSLSLGAGDLPESGLAYVRALRNMKYQEVLFELMAKQYELAKVDEAKDSSLIQVLDTAKPADRKSKPKRALMVALGLMGGLFAGVLLALLREQYAKSKQANGSAWTKLVRAWRNEAN